jgi:hypothetical protein
MRRKPRNILAVNPGTRYLGLAIFQEDDLVCWSVKVLEGKWSREKIRDVETILLGHIEHYGVTVLVTKDPHSYRGSRNLTCLSTAIGRLAKKEGLRLRFYSLGSLKDALAHGMKTTKMGIAGTVAARYRFLIPLLEREGRNKHSYFIRMFEATAAGMVEFIRHRH